MDDQLPVRDIRVGATSNDIYTVTKTETYYGSIKITWSREHGIDIIETYDIDTLLFYTNPPEIEIADEELDYLRSVAIKDLSSWF